MKKISDEGFDSAIVGMLSRCGQEDIIVYDYDKVIAVLTERDGMTDEEAIEYAEFNILGAWVGDGTPGFLHQADLDVINEYLDTLFEEEDE